MKLFCSLGRGGGRWTMRYPDCNCPHVFYRYGTIEEAITNEGQLKERGLDFVRFEAQSVIFDVPAEILWDSKVISRSFTQGRMLVRTESATSGPHLNEEPIHVPFSAEQLEDFLFALAFFSHHRDLEAFTSAALCTIMKVADYFECPTILHIVFTQINKRLAGKSPLEICAIFDILNEITQSQREQMETEGLWYFNCST